MPMSYGFLSTYTPTECGLATFTAAAATLGYTQSAVSRQIAAIERAAGAELLERRVLRELAGPVGPEGTAVVLAIPALAGHLLPAGRAGVPLARVLRRTLPDG